MPSISAFCVCHRLQFTTSLTLTSSNLLFMGTVGMVFAPLAPLVVVAAAIVLWVSSWVYKYQLMFVFISRVETGGRIWNVVINRLLISVILMQLLVVLSTYAFTPRGTCAHIPPSHWFAVRL